MKLSAGALGLKGACILALALLLSSWVVGAVSHETILDLVRKTWRDDERFLGLSNHVAQGGHDFGNENHAPRGRGSESLLVLNECVSLNPFLKVAVDATEPLADVQTVSVTVSGVLHPDEDDWVAVVSPTSDSNFTGNCPYAKVLYLETGDTQELPLLCHYPLKFQYVKSDPQYLKCERAECRLGEGGQCMVKTCSGALEFRLINVRSDVVFVFFTHGLDQPCILQTSATPLAFANPRSPLYAHLSSVTSAADSMRVTWVSGDGEPQAVVYGNESTTVKSSATTFQPGSMCDTGILAPATGFGWHDPGFIHSAVLTGLRPSSWHEYQYGSDKVGWSKRNSFRSPPEGGASQVTVIMYADMGKNERDGSSVHFLQEGALDVIDAVAKEVEAGDVGAVFHVGDISYATGFLVEWDMFLEMIGPVASRVPYMTASGNHERDFPGSGSVYDTTDSGGECGVPYESHFQMPSQGPDKPWYSIEYGPIHFTVMSTEMQWTLGSEQYTWIEEDLASINRSRTPWVIFSGHRPLYSTVEANFINNILHSVDTRMREAIEPLLVQYKVDIATWGHVHQYERTCAIQKDKCIYEPIKNNNGIDNYNPPSYCGPIHLIIGMGGFRLDQFHKIPAEWSLVRIAEFGYTLFHATHDHLTFEFVLAKTGEVGDQFEIWRNTTNNN